VNLEEIRAKVCGTTEVDVPGASAVCAYASHLLSDVMGHADDGCVLITIQNHLNTIAVCTLVGIEVIVICHGRPVPDDMREAAAREGVAVVVTQLSQYAASLALSALPPCAR
jgi:sugar phosphate isomerase/epimerase